jgi:eukaryotic-like serine/threonine-protein kinase
VTVRHSPAVEETSSAGRYELLEQLQSSATGATWRARDRETGGYVDIRQLRPPAQLASEQRRAMMARQARAALRAQRARTVSGLVPVTDVLASDDEILVVTEPAAGRALAEVLRDETRLPSDRAKQVAAELAATLERLHGLGLVHGDVRPSRIRIDGDEVRLVTQGLGRPEEDEPEATLLASPAYLSPERASGARVSAADDIWSLGVLLHAMVEGTPPFTGHSVDELVRAVVNQPAPRTTAADPMTAELVASMLDKDPSRRPSAAEVKAALVDATAEPSELALSESAPSAATPAQPAPSAATPAQPAPSAATPVDPAHVGAPVRPPTPAAKPAASPAATILPATTSSTSQRRAGSRRRTSRLDDISPAIPLVGIVVLLLLSWFFLSHL